MRKLFRSHWFWFVMFCIALGIVFYSCLVLVGNWATTQVQASSDNDYTTSELVVEQNFGTQNNNGYLIQVTDNPQKEAGQY